MRWVVVAATSIRGTARRRSERDRPSSRPASLRGGRGATRRPLVVSGEPTDDLLLEGLAPLLGDLLADLTERQREIGWPLLVEGLRRSEAAERPHVSRATISVAADRAHLRGDRRSCPRRADLAGVHRATDAA